MGEIKFDLFGIFIYFGILFGMVWGVLRLVLSFDKLDEQETSYFKLFPHDLLLLFRGTRRPLTFIYSCIYFGYGRIKI